jgi:NAD(P)-dependent dehydrogenase (short-subunit alcohol dehydrogenase family)
MMQLLNKVVLITGAKGGLGTYVTRAFLDAGAKVAGVSRSIRDSDFHHPSFAAVPAELSSPESAAQLAQTALSRFPRVDALVHLMGGFAGGQSVADTEAAVFERMLDLNLRSALYVARAFLPAMRERGAGRILAVGSRTAVEPKPMLGAYTVSKAALVALIRTIALENRDRGITANLVLPGTMDTPANRAAMPDADPAKWVQPEQVAAMLVHLASDAASDVNGAVIPIYGGEL